MNLKQSSFTLIPYQCIFQAGKLRAKKRLLIMCNYRKGAEIPERSLNIKTLAQLSVIQDLHDD